MSAPRKIFYLLSFLSVLLIFNTAVYSETPKEKCLAFLKKGKELLEKSGREEAFKQFDDLKGKFIDGDIYLYTLTMDGKCIQHAINKKLVNLDVNRVKDSSGKLFIQEIIETAKTKDSGAISYHWTHPETKKIKPKEGLFQKVKDAAGELILVTGYYTDESK
ncbi:MAG: cache domain-containing protein [Oligoflexia bacterium]|nr:cache domain-containing protein [Oligoflexia bacterium]